MDGWMDGWEGDIYEVAGHELTEVVFSPEVSRGQTWVPAHTWLVLVFALHQLRLGGHAGSVQPRRVRLSM